MPHRARLLEREREGAADQPDADDDELLDRDGHERLRPSSAAAQRGEEPLVLGVEAHGHAQVLGHAVAADRPHDDAAPQEALEDRARPALADARISTLTKLPYDGM